MEGQEQEKNQQECWGLQDGKCYWGILASDGPSGHCTDSGWGSRQGGRLHIGDRERKQKQGGFRLWGRPC